MKGKVPKTSRPGKGKAQYAKPAVGKFTTVAKTINPSSSILRTFECALDDPFCSSSYGAKIPDEYAFPTEAATFRHKFTTTASGGEVIVCTPHPSIGSVGIGSGSSNPSFSSVSGVSGGVQINSVVGNVNTVSRAAPFGIGAFQSAYTSYRVVGWGVRLRNVSAAATVAGESLVSVLPCGQHAPSSFYGLGGTPVSNPGSTWTEFTSAFSLPTNVYSSTNGTFGNPVLASIDSLGYTETYTSAELAQSGGVTILPKFHSPASAWRFRPTGTPSSNSNTVGTGSLITSAVQGGAGAGPGAISSFDPDWLDISGHNCVVMVLGGGSGGQTYEVEVIYHVEAISRINSSGTGIVPTAYAASPRVPRPLLDRTLDKIMSTPWVQFARHEGEKLYGAMVQALPGLMSKAAMSALMA